MPFYNKLLAENSEDRRTIENLIRLRKQLDSIPGKDQDEHLLVATWNLREFGAAKPKYGKRTQESLYYIAEVMSRFDLIAVQEIRSDLSELDRLIEILGYSMWKYVVTDVVYGKQGNDERLAFIYDTRKLSFGGLAGEVVPPQVKKSDGLLATEDAFARTPYIVGFRAGWFKFSIVTMHSYYGDGEKDPQRIKEMEDLVELLKKRIKAPDRWARNVILLGDFNIFSSDDPAMKALTKVFKRAASVGVGEPGSNQDRSKPYDQIGFLSPDVGNQLEKAKSGVFDPYESVYRLDLDEKQYKWNDTNARSFKEWRSFQLSDHLPKWVQVNVNFADDYLTMKLAGGDNARPAMAVAISAKKKAVKKTKKKAVKKK